MELTTEEKRMLEKLILEIKSEYLKRIKERNELERLCNTKSVLRYQELMNLEKPCISSNISIMGDIIESHKIKLPTSETLKTEIIFDYGLYLKIYDTAHFVPDDIDRNYVEEYLRKRGIYYDSLYRESHSLFKNYDYFLSTTKEENDRNIIIKLPFLKEELEKLSYNLEEYHPRFYSYNFYQLGKIATYQLYERLMYNSITDVFEYYKNPSNHQEIEDYLFSKFSLNYKKEIIK